MTSGRQFHQQQSLAFLYLPIAQEYRVNFNQLLAIMAPKSLFLASAVAAVFAIGSHAREIHFSSNSRLLGQQLLGTEEEDMFLASPKFFGLSTYAGVPYVHCLAGDDEEVEKYDIAILGAPFDTVSWI